MFTSYSPVHCTLLPKSPARKLHKKEPELFQYTGIKSPRKSGFKKNRFGVHEPSGDPCKTIYPCSLIFRHTRIPHPSAMTSDRTDTGDWCVTVDSLVDLSGRIWLFPVLVGDAGTGAGITVSLFLFRSPFRRITPM